MAEFEEPEEVMQPVEPEAKVVDLDKEVRPLNVTYSFQFSRGSHLKYLIIWGFVWIWYRFCSFKIMWLLIQLDFDGKISFLNENSSYQVNIWSFWNVIHDICQRDCPKIMWPEYPKQSSRLLPSPHVTLHLPYEILEGCISDYFSRIRIDCFPPVTWFLDDPKVFCNSFWFCGTASIKPQMFMIADLRD